MHLIIKPFNAVYWGLMAMVVGLTALLTALLKHRGEKARLLAVGLLAAAAVAVYVLANHVWYPSSPEYLAYYYPKGDYNIWNELPLYPCNIVTMLLPVAIATNRKPLLGFCCLMGVMGGVMSMVSPISIFVGCDLLSRVGFGFYGKHALLLMTSALLATLGLYKPAWSDALRYTGWLAAMTVAAHLLNLLMRATGLNGHANYFYTIDTEGSTWLIALRRIIPYDCLYLLGSAPLSIALFAAIIAMFKGLGAVEARLHR